MYLFMSLYLIEKEENGWQVDNSRRPWEIISMVSLHNLHWYVWIDVVDVGSNTVYIFIMRYFLKKPLITLVLASWTLLCNPSKMPFRKLLGLTAGLNPLTLPLSRVNYFLGKCCFPWSSREYFCSVNRMTKCFREFLGK